MDEFKTRRLLGAGEPRDSILKHPLSKDCDIHVEDERVAKLLLVLSELDQSFGGVEGIEPSQLRDLICNALPACGFSNSRDACYAIAAVLRIIEGGPHPQRVGSMEGANFPADLQHVHWFSPC
jgi:hypothetical protein